jgi:hypothetical protein
MSPTAVGREPWRPIEVQGCSLAPANSLILRTLFVAPWWPTCVIGRKRSRAMRPLAANHVSDRCDRVRVKIRGHKDIRSEYVGQADAYGREGRDRSTP